MLILASWRAALLNIFATAERSAVIISPFIKAAIAAQIIGALDRRGVMVRTIIRFRIDVTSSVIVRPLPEQVWPLALPVLEGVDGGLAFEDGLQQLAIVEANVAQDGLLQVLAVVEVLTLEHVLDPAVEAFDHPVGLRTHGLGQAVLGAEPVGVVVAGGSAVAQAEQPVGERLAVVGQRLGDFSGAMRSRSRRNLRALAAVLAG